MRDVVIAVVQKDGVFAFLQRNDGGWTFPSGKIEDGECPDSAAVREALEETGLDVKVISDLGTREINGDRLHYRLCDCVSGDLAIGEPEKFKLALWLSPPVLLGYVRPDSPVARLMQNRMAQCRCALA